MTLDFARLLRFPFPLGTASPQTYFTKEVERLWREDGGAYGGIYSEFEADIPYIGAINKMSYADIKLGGGRNSVYDFELVSEGHETITEMSTTETITTSDNPGFEVADPAFEGETDTVVIFGSLFFFFFFFLLCGGVGLQVVVGVESVWQWQFT